MKWENMMDDPRPLINIGDLAKPADTLITKISDAIGGLYRPTQIKRIAQAEAEADKMRAVAQIEITDLQRRAVARFFMEEARKQDNMESIIGKALLEVNEQAQPDLVENDWIVHFFDRCRLISDSEMQNLWAKILSGQANAPGSYSKKTIETLANLEKSDAILFSSLCNFSVTVGDEQFPLIYDIHHPIYNDHQVTFAALFHLESLGLLQLDDSNGFILGGLGEKVLVSYFDYRTWLQLKTRFDETEFSLGGVMLTRDGDEIAGICEAHPIVGFVDYLKETWDSKEYIMEPEMKGSTTSQET